MKEDFLLFKKWLREQDIFLTVWQENLAKIVLSAPTGVGKSTVIRLLHNWETSGRSSMTK